MKQEPLLGIEHPYDALEVKADQSNFVVIDGTAIDIDNLIDLIHGREITPTLTRAELNTAYSDDDAGFLERKGGGLKRRIHERQVDKERRIKSIIRDHTSIDSNGVADIKLPRREQVLMALSKGRLRYSSLSEFLGQFAQLDSDSALLAADAINEVRGQIMEAQQASRISARPIEESLQAQDLRIIKSVLSLKQTNQIPIFLLERAILEIEAHDDDFAYFEEIRGDRGVNVPFNVDSAITSAVFAAPIFASVASLTGFITPEIAEFILSPSGVWTLGGGAAIKLTHHATKWSPISNRLRTILHSRSISQEAESHKKAFEDLKHKIDELKLTGKGRLILILLKEIILAQRDGGEHIKNRSEALSWLREPFWKDSQASQEFEDFAAHHDLSTFSSAQQVMNEFPKYKSAVRSLDAPFEVDEKHQQISAKARTTSHH